MNAHQFVNFYGIEGAKALRGNTANALLDMREYKLHVDDIDQAISDFELLEQFDDLNGLKTALRICREKREGKGRFYNGVFEKSQHELSLEQAIQRIEKNLGNTSSVESGEDCIKERPILLKSQEITAILEGHKTQIRRILKAKQGGDCPAEMWVDQFALKDVIEWREQEDQWFGLMGYRTLALANCPFGKVGDHLWVRETWAGVNLYGEIALAYKADSEVIRVVENESFQGEDGLINYDDPRLEKHSFAVWADDLLDGKKVAGSHQSKCHVGHPVFCLKSPTYALNASMKFPKQIA